MKNFNRQIQYLIVTLAVLAFSACHQDDLENDLNVSREIHIENNEQVLAGRMNYSYDTLQITSQSGSRVAKNFELVLEGEIESPQIEGNTLQAVSINNTGGKIFISYNYAGSDYLGGIDYVTEKLVLKASILYEDADVNAVTIGEGHLYAVGATALDSPAFVEKIKFSSNGFSLEDNSRTFLGSYASTSVVYHNKNVYVTTGNDMDRGGGLYQLDKDLNLLNYAGLHDARWAVEHDDQLVVAQGTPGTISIVDTELFENTGSFGFDGANIAEAKTTVDIDKDLLFIAGGEEGVYVYDLTDNSLLHHISSDEVNAVANAVTAENGLLFISNGTNVYVAEYDTKETSNSPNVLGKIEFEDELSANHIMFRGSRMFIASGMGGVKMVKVIK